MFNNYLNNFPPGKFQAQEILYIITGFYYAIVMMLFMAFSAGWSAVLITLAMILLMILLA